MKQLVLFDGECRFCNRAITFIMDRDPNMHFQFAHLSSKTGLKYFQDLNIPTEVDSLILIQGNKYFTESTAALKISKHLNKGWPLMYGLIIVPKFVRNFMYRLIANHRYTLFGTAKACQIPSEKDRQRFLL